MFLEQYPVFRIVAIEKHEYTMPVCFTQTRTREDVNVC